MNLIKSRSLPTKKLVIICCGLFLCTLLLKPASSQKQIIKIPPWNEHYSPTKLEWAAIQLQGQCNFVYGGGSTKIWIMPLKGGKILFCLIYPDNLTAANLQFLHNQITSTVESYKKSNGWNWITIEFKDTSQGELSKQ